MDSGAFANNAIVAEPTEFVDSRINDSEAIRSKSGQDGDRKFKSDEPWTVSRGCPSPGTSTSEVGQGIVQKTSQEVKVFYPFHFTLSLCATFKHCQSTVEALSKHCRSTVLNFMFVGHWVRTFRIILGFFACISGVERRTVWYCGTVSCKKTHLIRITECKVIIVTRIRVIGNF